MGGLNQQDLENKGIFAPKIIITASAGVPLDVRPYHSVGTPSEFEYYINSESGDKMTRTGVINIHPEVATLTFTAETVLEAM